MNKKEKETLKSIIENSGLKENLQININDERMVDLMADYIKTHKWLVNENIKLEVTCDQAIFSWFENIYRPLWYAMNDTLIFRAFPKKKPIELFSAISDMHYHLSTANPKGWIPYDYVCREYIKKNSKRKLIKFLTRIGF